MPFVTSNGTSTGVKIPRVMSGQSIAPHYLFCSTTMSAAANDLYYLPIWVPEVTTWAGIKTSNGGAGDNGDIYRVGIYEESSSGGPGSLLKDCGTVTLDASAAVRTTASSFTNTYVGWHYLAIHFQNAITMSNAQVHATDSSVGRYPINNAAAGMPQLTVAPSYNGIYVIPFINTTYGALASTAVTPTSSVNNCPQMFIYK